MSTQRDFDRIADAWLAEGPTVLADRVLDAALAEVHQTRQRRSIGMSWRATRVSSLMTRIATATAAVVVIVIGGVFAFGGGIGGPAASPPPTPERSPIVSAGTPSPSAASSASASPPTASAPPAASPSPYATATTFTSAAFGYTAAIPAGWTVIAATQPWDGRSGFSFDSPVVDQIKPPDVVNRCTDVYVCAPFMWAFGDPTSDDLTTWVAARSAADSSEHACPPPESSSPITLDGGPGVLTSGHCGNGGGPLILSAFAVRNGLGYAFYLQENDHEARVEQLDRSDFLAFLSGVRLGG